MKLIKFIFIFLILVFLTFIFIKHDDPSAVAKKHFQVLLGKGKSDTLDLSKLGDSKWDELIIWPPYADICDFGIDGYEKGSSSCESLNDDSENYLLLLSGNQLVARIPVDRKQADFTMVNVQGRLPRDKARFRFLSKGDGPAIELIGKSGTH